MNCLFGTTSDNIAGYCCLHNKNMTVKQIKYKECLGKQCKYLRKNEEHDWWRQREVVKNRKKEKRNNFKEKIEMYAG